MANTEQFSLLLQDVDTWNVWRLENPSINVDLRWANLSEANLSKANLSGANLSESNFSKANLSEANLSGTNLSRALIHYAYLSKANLSKANLSKANLKGTNLSKANLSEADLSEADITEADLNWADFRKAVLERTKVSSQSQLQQLAYPLSDEQIVSIFFEDELEFARQTKFSQPYEEGPLLRLTIGGESPWTSINMAGLLLAIQASYNNMHYLITTENSEIEYIKANIIGYRPVGVEDNIKINSIKSGSLAIEIANLALANKEIIGSVLAAMCAFVPTLIMSMAKYKEASSKKIEATAKLIVAEANAGKIHEETHKLRIENQKEEDSKHNHEVLVPGPVLITPSPEVFEYITAYPTPESPIKEALDQIGVVSPTVEENKYTLFMQATRPLINMSLKLEELGHERISFDIVKKRK